MSLLVSEVVNAQLGESSGGKANPPRTIGVMGIFLTDYHTMVAVGEKIPFEVGFIPANATDQSYTIHDDSDGALIEVDDTGSLVAKAEGTTSLTFKSKDGGYETVLVIEIKAALKPITSITIPEPVKQMHINDVQQLTAVYLPADAERTDLFWSTSDSTIATVSDDGVVIARALGDFTITVTSPAYPPATADVTATWVSKVVEAAQPVTGVDLSIDKTTILSNETATLIVNVLPANADNKDYSFTMSPTGKASINKTTGVVTPQVDFDGDLTITVKTAEGNFTDSVTLHVDQYIAVQSVAFQESGKKIDLPVLTTHDAQVAVLPANASNNGLTFVSSHPEFASVDVDGKITANKMGEATITVTSVDKPTATDTLVVTVVDNPDLIHDYRPSSNVLTVTGSDNEYTVDGMQDDGTAYTINLSVVPATGTWGAPTAIVQSGDDVITTPIMDEANQRFTITGLKPGVGVVRLHSGTVGVDQVITHITFNVVHGNVAVTGVEITDGDSINVNLSSGTKQLTAVVSPAGATNKAVTWSSSDTAVVEVTNAGLATVKKGGSATLTVTTTDGGFTDNILVNVTDDVNIPVTGVTIQEGATLSVNWDGTAGTTQLHAVVAPANANNKSVNWSVTPAGVLTVASDGKLSLIKAGTATVKATTVDGGFEATCAVTVVDKRSATLSTDSVPLAVVNGKPFALTYTTNPAGVTLTDKVFASADPTVISVDASTGVMTFLKEGSTTVSLTAKDPAGNSRTDGSSITVSELGAHTDSFAGAINVGQTAQLVWQFTPTGVDQMDGFKVEFTTEDNTVATVDNKGLATGVGDGFTRIGVKGTLGTATAQDSSGLTVNAVPAP